MFCSHCGNRLEEDAKYCQTCGAPANGSIPENQYRQETVQSQVAKPAGDERNPSNGKVYVILGWIFFGLSFLIVPLLFGAGAFIMGFLTFKVRSQTHGVVLMVMAVVGTVFGMIIGVFVASMTYLQ